MRIVLVLGVLVLVLEPMLRAAEDEHDVHTRKYFTEHLRIVLVLGVLVLVLEPMLRAAEDEQDVHTRKYFTEFMTQSTKYSISEVRTDF